MFNLVNFESAEVAKTYPRGSTVLLRTKTIVPKGEEGEDYYSYTIDKFFIPDYIGRWYRDDSHREYNYALIDMNPYPLT